MQLSDLNLTKPLNKIFWGVVIIIIDLNLNFGFINIDIINDVIGSLLIISGLRYLRRIYLDDYFVYQKNISTAYYAAILLTILSITTFFVYDLPELTIVKSLFEIYVIHGMINFTLSMKFLTEAGNFKDISKQWEKNGKLFFWLYLIPILLITLIDILSIINGNEYSFYRDTDFSIALIIFLILLFPCIYSLILIKRTQKEIKRHRYT